MIDILQGELCDLIKELSPKWTNQTRKEFKQWGQIKPISMFDAAEKYKLLATIFLRELRRRKNE